MEDGKGTAQETGKWGYRWLIGLLICIFVGAVLWTFFLPKENEKGQTLGENSQQQEIGNRQSELYVDSPISTIDSKDNPSGGRSGEKTGGNGAENFCFEAPVKNAGVLKEYSEEQPIYSKTLDQFETHCGVDFAADLNAQVFAASAGTVVKIEQDDKYGKTIEIDHGNGYVTRYSNLNDAVLVEEGDVVESGAEIGTVGATALFETMDPPHLHFEIRKDGAFIDPQSVLK